MEFFIGDPTECMNRATDAARARAHKEAEEMENEILVGDAAREREKQWREQDRRLKEFIEQRAQEKLKELVKQMKLSSSRRTQASKKRKQREQQRHRQYVRTLARVFMPVED